MANIIEDKDFLPDAEINDEYSLLEIDNGNVEKMLQDAMEISKETEDLLLESEAGTLSDTRLREFKAKGNRFLTSLKQDTVILSGLQNDVTISSGLLNLKTDVKNAAISIAELAKKAIANIFKFFSDMFTKILTKTQVLEDKLKLVDTHLARSSNEIEVSFSAFRSIFMKFEMVSLANKWDVKSPTIASVYSEMVDLLTTMRTSKIPKVQLSLDSLINTREYVNENKTTLESELVEYFLSKDSTAKELKLDRSRAKVIRIARDRVDFAVFSEDGRDVFLTYMRSDRDPKVRIAPVNVIDKINVSILTEAIKESISILKNKLRNETNDRIKALKDVSDKLVQEFGKATSDIKSPEEKTKWDLLSKDIKNIWTIYPHIGNKSILNLHSILNILLDWIIETNKISVEKTI